MLTFFLLYVHVYVTPTARHMEDDTVEGRVRREQQDGIIKMSARLFMPDDGITFNKFPDAMKRAVICHMAAAPCKWPPALTQRRFETLITNYRRLHPRKKEQKRRNVKEFGNQDGLRPPPRRNNSRSRTPRRKHKKRPRACSPQDLMPDMGSSSPDDDDDELTNDDDDEPGTRKPPKTEHVDLTEHRTKHGRNRSRERSTERGAKRGKERSEARSSTLANYTRDLLAERSKERKEQRSKEQRSKKRGEGSAQAPGTEDDSSSWDDSGDDVQEVQDKNEVRTQTHTSACIYIYIIDFGIIVFAITSGCSKQFMFSGKVRIGHVPFTLPVPPSIRVYVPDDAAGPGREGPAADG